MRRLGLAAAGLAVLASCFLTACPHRSATLVDFARIRHAYVPADYPNVYHRWTRSALVLKDYDTSLDVTATFKTYDFRLAYAVRYASVYRLEPPEQEKLLKRQLLDLDAVHEFHVSASASRFEWVDFSRSDSVWRVTMADDQGHEVRPIGIRRLKLPRAEIEAFFPPSLRGSVVEAFYTPYVFRFPTKLPDGTPFVTPSTRTVALRFNSVLGSAELRWIASKDAE